MGVHRMLPRLIIVFLLVIVIPAGTPVLAELAQR